MSEPAAPAPDGGHEVCFVLMPYAPLERPSIALSILKALLTGEGFGATVVYANLLFALQLGPHAYDIVGKTQSHSLGGEWTFSHAAFPAFDSDKDAYFAHIQSTLSSLQPMVRTHGGRGRVRSLLEYARTQATAFVDATARRVLAMRPRIVGCSSTFQQHCASLALLRRIKELDPGVLTLLGGANCEGSMGVATHMECPWVDYVISGEAEDALLALCQRLLRSPPRRDGGAKRSLLLAKDERMYGVLGPELRRDGGAGYAALIADPPRAKLEDMGRSPTPDYDDYFATMRDSPLALMVIPGMLIETSRGCWWGEISHCTFCGLNGTSMGYRAKPPARVVEEFDYLAKRYGAKSFEVVDNILDLQYFKTVLPALAAGGGGLDIFYETKANLSRAHLEQMAAAGIRWLQPGIESLDDSLLHAIAKGTTARQNLQLMKWAREYGIYVLWIFLYDIPGEDDARYVEMAQWLPLVSHLQAPSGLSFIQYNRFSPYHMRPAEYGLRLDPDRSYAFVYPWSAETITRFAYFFDDYSEPREQLGMLGRPIRREGLRRLYQAVAAWQVQWRGHMNAGADPAPPATLVMKSEGGRLRISDTRACRVAPQIVIDGLAARVYEACDRARSAEGLMRELAATGTHAGSWEDVEPVVRDLVDKKLLLALDGWFFSLALRGPLPPMPNIGNYPGGRLRKPAEARAAELTMYAEQLTGATLIPL